MTRDALVVDGAQIASFVEALFVYADEDTFVALRGFNQHDSNRPAFITKGVQVNGRTLLIKQATETAHICANNVDPIVFAPPIATFTNPDRARTADLANGLTLSVEIDDVDPRSALTRLESLLGPATVVIASGSEWLSPVTGELQPKLHLHWRLSEPTRTPEDHDLLRHARAAATTLIGGDPTAKPIVHPLRWPGSWNRKGIPVLAHIVALNASQEIHLAEAADILSEAAGSLYAPPELHHGITSPSDARTITSAFALIPNPGTDVHYDTWIRMGYAAYRALADDGFEPWAAWSRKSAKFDPTETQDAWLRIAHAVHGTNASRQISAGTIFFEAAKHGWERPEEVPNLLLRAHAEYRRRVDAGEISPEAPPFADWNQTPSGFRAPAPQVPIVYPATALSALDLDHIPPRQWIYGRELVRRYVSVLASPGGTGKTAYTMAVGLSIAINRALLRFPGFSGVLPHCTIHKPGPVWFVNLEDPLDELLRRIKATMMHHGITSADLADRVYLDSGRDRELVVAVRDERGMLIVAPVVAPLVAEIIARGIVALIVDPFVQSHQGEENRNEEMNLVMAAWGRVASQANCAVWLVHHFRKGGKSGDSESFRGAVAIQGAARSMFTMATMQPEEAEKLGVDETERWQYVRHDNAKSNMAPPASAAMWFRLASVELGNGDADYPAGDYVQAVEAWTPPSPWADLAWFIIERILLDIDAGPGDGEFYSSKRQAGVRWAGKVIISEATKTDSAAAAILAAWIKSGVLELGQYASPRQKGAIIGCVRLNGAKFIEMKAQLGTPNRSELDE